MDAALSHLLGLLHRAPLRMVARYYPPLCALVATAHARLLAGAPQKALDKPPGPGPRLLTFPEVASLLRISEDAARELGRRGKLRVVRIGRRVRVPVDAIEELLGGRSK